jgi:hypothetical protein
MDEREEFEIKQLRINTNVVKSDSIFVSALFYLDFLANKENKSLRLRV